MGRTRAGRTKAPNRAARAAMSGILTTVGVAHFVVPDGFEAIVPEELPARRALVYGSGVAEIGLGIALALKPTRRVGWAVVALLLAVFPANVNMAVREIDIPDAPPVPRWLLWARLPGQLVMVWAALAATRPVPADAP